MASCIIFCFSASYMYLCDILDICVEFCTEISCLTQQDNQSVNESTKHVTTITSITFSSSAFSSFSSYYPVFCLSFSCGFWVSLFPPISTFSNRLLCQSASFWPKRPRPVLVSPSFAPFRRSDIEFAVWILSAKADSWASLGDFGVAWLVSWIPRPLASRSSPYNPQHCTMRFIAVSQNEGERKGKSLKEP